MQYWQEIRFPKLLLVLALSAAACGGGENVESQRAGGTTAVAQSEGAGAAASGATGLAAELYVDPKGYFRIVPPAGWQVQEYPEDPRGKVGFLTAGGTVSLRVLVDAVDITTQAELVEFCRNAERRYGQPMNIEAVNWQGYEAVRRTMNVSGITAVSVDFLVGSHKHNLMFSAPAGKEDDYERVVTMSMSTYEPVSRKGAAGQAAEHRLARKLRLASLMHEMGDDRHALAYIREGLEIDPDNAELLRLRADIEAAGEAGR